MEEDNESKETVTRLRSRLSIDQADNVSSPATSTKKRGQPAAKAQPENVDDNKPVTRLRRRLSIEQAENASSPVITPTKKRGGRSAAKPQLENIDENTPVDTQKLTRRKSVAKDISEPLESRTGTPTRRTTRLLSNTSLTLETSQVVDSPRARRAARRNSVAGSDNEATTPVKTTRRTRKDSTSSVEGENAPPTVTHSVKPVTETIVEEPEIQSISSTDFNDENVSPNSLRKSPRLAKKNRNSDANESRTTESSANQSINNKSISQDKQVTSSANKEVSVLKENTDNNSANLDVSIANSKIIEDISNEHHTTTSVKSHLNDDVLSDTELLKMEKNRSLNISKNLNITGSGDCLNSMDVVTKTNATNIQVGSEKSSSNSKDDEMNIMLRADSHELHCEVYIIDDSNSDNSKPFQDAGDQCVPVVQDEIDGLPKNTLLDGNSSLHTSKNGSISITNEFVKTNTSYEPMDVDIDFTDETSLNNNTKRNKSLSETNNNSKMTLIEQNESKIENDKKDLKSNEEKSTLIISQIKDDSGREESKHEQSKNNSVTNQREEKSMQNESINKSNDSNINTSNNKSSNKMSNISDRNTPLKPNHLKGVVGMKTSTPVVASKQTKSKSTKVVSKDSSDSEQSDSENEESEQSNILDDEAEDAGEDYESGDSQDEDERRYEDENNFVERGETLESDEDVSNDSDYEKDSFVVSSLEEDNDLLDGTGDDLGDSDNELTQSRKSKDKYNLRKEKERKYLEELSRKENEVRSTESDSDDEEITKPIKKKKAQILRSSFLGSEDDSIVKPKKKNNRLRLNSTDEVDSYISLKKNNRSKIKDDSKVDEQEITAVCEESMLQKEDPLIVKAIKQEINTPHKELGTSRMDISISHPINEVEVDENMSMAKANETTDPLQMNADENDSSNQSLESENHEIMNNFDNLLKGLNNKGNTKKVQDLSLDLNRQPGKKSSKTVIEQLNITQTKFEKNKKTKNKLQPSQPETEKSKKNVEKITKGENSSSDSLDLKLLFPEDDSDSAQDFIPIKKVEGKTNILAMMMNDVLDGSDLNVTSSSKKKKKSTKNTVDDINISKDTSKTAMEASDFETSQLVTLFIPSTPASNKKRKKKNSLAPAIVENASKEAPENATVQDTPSKLLNITTNTPKDSQKKKKKGVLECTQEQVDVKDTSLTVQTPSKLLDVTSSVSKSSEKKKKKRNSGTVEQNTDLEIVDDAAVQDTSTKLLNITMNTPQDSQKKKKKRNSESTQQTDVEDASITVQTPSNLSAVTPNITKSSDRKKKNRNSDIAQQNTDVEVAAVEDATEQDTSTKWLNTTMNTPQDSLKKKKKSNLDASEMATSLIIATPNSGKKKKQKNSVSEEAPENATANVEDTSMNTPKDSQKKKKRNSECNQSIQINIKDASITEETPTKLLDVTSNMTKSSEKKKKKRNSETVEQNTDIEVPAIEDTTEQDTTTKLLNVTMNTPQDSQKKKKKRNSESTVQTDVEDSSVTVKSPSKSSATDAASNIVKSSEKKKKKRNSEAAEQNTHIEKGDANSSVQMLNTSNIDLNVSNTTTPNKSNKKKKNKRNSTCEDTQHENEDVITKSSVVNEGNIDNVENVVDIKESKKRKRNSSVNIEEDVAKHSETVHETSAKENKNRKKKVKVSVEENDTKIGSTTETEQARETQSAVVDIDGKKRKRRVDDTDNQKPKKTKIAKDVPVPRLPSELITKLDQKSAFDQQNVKKTKAISTSSFVVEEITKRKNKPSHYLEESIYLDADSPEKRKNKDTMKRPKVLPFIPTASTSTSGFTDQFKVNILPKEVKFVPQTDNTQNFKKKYLEGKQIKRMGTYEFYKKQRSFKLSKY